MRQICVIATVTLSLLVGGIKAGILENAASAIQCPQVQPLIPLQH